MKKILNLLMCLLILVGASAPNDSTNSFDITLVNTLNPYSANHVIGGVVTLRDLNKRRRSTSGIIRQVTIIDREAKNTRFTLTFFDTLPTTPPDNTLFNPSNTDLFKITLGLSGGLLNQRTPHGGVSITTGDTVYQAGGSAFPPLPFRVQSQEDLYVVVRIRDSATYTRTDALVMRVLFTEEGNA